MSMKILMNQYFSMNGLTPRPEQQLVIDQLELNWSKYNYFVLSLPTGVGKTHISNALCYSQEKGGFTLTSSRLLQDQYESSYPGLVSVKGKGNYVCEKNEKFNCSDSICNSEKSIKKDCIESNSCLYYRTLGLAFKSKQMVLNNSVALFASSLGFLKESDTNRDVIIYDEAHSLESSLVNFVEMNFSLLELHEKFRELEDDLIDLEFTENNRTNFSVITKIYEAMLAKRNEHESRLSSLLESFKKNTKYDFSTLSGPNSKKVKELRALIFSYDEYLRPMSMFIKSVETVADLVEKYVMQYDPKTEKMYLAPLYGKFVYQAYLEKLSPKQVFMSATFCDITTFCEELGIRRSDVCVIETGTPFPKENSPIQLIPMLKLGYANISTTLEDIGEVIDAILDNHKNEKGIIHAGNYTIQQSIYLKTSKENAKRLLCRDMSSLNGRNKKFNNSELLEMHQQSKSSSVLLSPSMNEGVDLKDDLSRFQIIVKLPWKSLVSPRIKRKTDLNSNWYSALMWNEVMQASGRSSRHMDDKSVTYVLDASCVTQFKKFKQKLPNWFNERVIIN